MVTLARERGAAEAGAAATKEEDAEDADAVVGRYPPGIVKRVVALHIGYVGTGFRGSQARPGPPPPPLVLSTTPQLARLASPRLSLPAPISSSLTCP